MTNKEFNTLVLIRQVNEIVKTNMLNGEELTELYDEPIKVYRSIYEDNPYETLEIFKDIYRLSKLGYVKTNIKESDLTVENINEMLKNDYLKIVETTTTERGLICMAEYIKEVIGYEEGKYNLQELECKIAEFLKSDKGVIFTTVIIPIACTLAQIILGS